MVTGMMDGLAPEFRGNQSGQLSLTVVAYSGWMRESVSGEKGFREMEKTGALFHRN